MPCATLVRRATTRNDCSTNVWCGAVIVTRSTPASETPGCVGLGAERYQRRSVAISTNLVLRRGIGSSKMTACGVTPIVVTDNRQLAYGVADPQLRPG